MTVVVGHLTGKGGLAALHLAAGLARALKTSLTVATIVPKPWPTPSPARIDAEYAQWAEQLAADSAAEAQRYLSTFTEGLEITYEKLTHQSASRGLIEIVENAHAEALVLGSSPDSQLGMIIGSTADRLMHSSPVPLAISPRGYRGSLQSAPARLTCGFPGTPQAVPVVQRVAELAQRFGVPMRVITLAVRGRTMYPPEVGLHAEDSILEAWASHAQETLEQLTTDGVIPEDTERQVVTGNSWEQALNAVQWEDGEILALGTSPRGGVARVFLGSRATKIIRHSPIPVLILPE